DEPLERGTVVVPEPEQPLVDLRDVDRYGAGPRFDEGRDFGRRRDERAGGMQGPGHVAVGAGVDLQAAVAVRAGRSGEDLQTCGGERQRRTYGQFGDLSGGRAVTRVGGELG